MKKKISVGAALGIAGITAVVVFFATSFAQLNMIGALTNNAWYQEPLYQKIHAIEQIVEKQFDGEIEEKQLMDYVSRGYMAGLGDRFSLYFSKEDLEEFLISEAGELVGIGVTGIQDPETGYIRVESVYKGSPADLAGLRAGDLLTAVDGTGVLEVGYEEAINQIRGEEGTSVSLTFLRDGAEQDLHIVRQKIEVPSVSYQLYGDNGYIAVTSFNETTARQFQQAVESLQAQGAEKLIFDMRNNGGGLLSSVEEILDYLLPEGVIAIATYADGTTEEIAHSEPGEIDMPMAVLTNEHTASAAELFTAALKDYDKAVQVGDTTFGKGVMQQLFTLSDGSGINLTVAHFNPPKTSNFHETGLTPDYPVSLSEEEALRLQSASLELAEDPQFLKACAVLEGQE